MPWKGIGVAIAVVVASLVVLGRAGGVVVDWAWFSTIGYVGVFWTVFATKAALFLAVFVVSSLLLWVNGTLALRFASRRRPWLAAVRDAGSATVRALPGTPAELSGSPSLRLPWRLLILVAALLIGLLIAIGETGKWDLILRFVYQVPYGRNDPLFDKDIGFYLFSLPVYVALKNWILLILFLSALMAGAVYFVHGQINLDRWPWRISSAVIAHGSALLGLYFAVKAWSYALDRFLLLYGDNGVVVGAGYSDIHVELPVLWLLVCLAAARYRCRLGQRKAAQLPSCHRSGGAGFRQLVYFRRGGPWTVRALLRQAERTAVGSAVHQAEHRSHPGSLQPPPNHGEAIPRRSKDLTFQSLQDNRGTINNIRLWDWQPLMDTYAQLQEIRTYYKFLDVDVDRYHSTAPTSR